MIIVKIHAKSNAALLTIARKLTIDKTNIRSIIKGSFLPLKTNSDIIASIMRGDISSHLKKEH